MSHSGFQLCHPSLTLEYGAESRGRGFYRIWYFMQRCLALVALTAALPMLVCLWLLVRIESKGPFLFKQQRIGLNGKIFEVYKIRTMRKGSESVTRLGTRNDNPQVTSSGRVLRNLKLDELPQLYNIVKGDMAIVGPRPIPLALDAELCQKIADFHKRYDVRPGLTSIGQICITDNQLDERLVQDWRIRFEGELHYIRNQGLRYDLLMVLMTSLYVVRKLGVKTTLKTPQPQVIGK